MTNIIYITHKRCSKCGGNLQVRSDIILPSYPVQYEAKCKDCNNIEYLYADDIIADTQTIEKEPHISTIQMNGDNLVVASRYSSSCIVCGDLVETLTPYETGKICENCKQAILKVRFGQLKAEIIDEINKEKEN